MTTKYLVKHGPKGDHSGISIMTANKDYAEGYAAGINHATQGAWRYVEEVQAIPEGTKVRVWPGALEGRSIDTTIRKGHGILLIGGTPCQWVEDYAGGIALTHIEVIGEEK